MRLEPEDDLFHAPDDDQNYNESRYYNFLAAPSEVGTSGFGGWVRMGNRPNEHYAEMTVCLYLPDGRVGFMFKRPHIEGHVAHDAGGLKFDVVDAVPGAPGHLRRQRVRAGQPARDGRSRHRVQEQPARGVLDRPAPDRGVGAVGW